MWKNFKNLKEKAGKFYAIKYHDFKIYSWHCVYFMLYENKDRVGEQARMRSQAMCFLFKSRTE